MGEGDQGHPSQMARTSPIRASNQDPGCPVCVEEAGSKVNHRRKKGDRSPGVMHCDLATFEDGNKYCLVASTILCPDAQEGCSMCGHSPQRSIDDVRQSQFASNSRV